MTRTAQRAELRSSRVIGCFAVGYVVLTGALLFGAAHPRDLHYRFRGPAWVDAWYRLDSDWYTAIVESGYHYIPGVQSPVAFFPGYPLTIRLLRPLVANPEVAGHLVTLSCGLGALLLLGRWARRWLSPRAATTTVAVVLLYPYALFVYGAVYADALFLLCVVGAFLLVERHWYAAAGLVGAVATATRPVGIALVVGLAVRVIEQYAEQRRAVDSVEADQPASGRMTRVGLTELLRGALKVPLRRYVVVVSGLGLAAWMAFLWSAFGDPLAFVNAESAWGQAAGPETWFKVTFFRLMVEGSVNIRMLLLAQAGVLLVALLMLPRVQRRFGWGYLAYTLVVLGIPLVGTSDFLGCGRYVLAAFPALAAFADLLSEPGRARWVRPVVLSASGGAMLVATYFFGQGILIS